MELYYHDDVVTRAFMAIHYAPPTPNFARETVGQLTNMRLAKPITNEPGPLQVALTVIGAIEGGIKDSSEDNPVLYHVPTGTFKPEKLEENSPIRANMLEQAGQGIFIPLMLIVDENDRKKIAQGKTMFTAMVGFGEKPDINFLIVSIDLGLALANKEPTPSDQVNIYFPVVFDAVRKIIGTSMDTNLVTVNTYIFHTPEEMARIESELANLAKSNDNGGATDGAIEPNNPADSESEQN